jgi:hypothetical protein
VKQVFAAFPTVLALLCALALPVHANSSDDAAWTCDRSPLLVTNATLWTPDARLANHEFLVKNGRIARPRLRVVDAVAAAQSFVIAARAQCFTRDSALSSAASAGISISGVIPTRSQSLPVSGSYVRATGMNAASPLPMVSTPPK